jgi:violaxanthin de-epoxidase
MEHVLLINYLTAECQIKCGDMFENDVVGVFNSCAVSQKKCVPQKQDDGSYPLPAASSMVKAFDTSIWNGRSRVITS